MDEHKVLDKLKNFISENGYKLDIKIRYSGRFRQYNASVTKRYNSLYFNLSNDWKDVDDEIALGLLQSLSIRILKLKLSTLNVDLYNNFIRSLHVSCAKQNSDPFLEASFNRINEKYFDGLVETPNFAWHFSRRRLASYDYHTDTVSVSSLFSQMQDIIDYLMYHELLHKKLKFSSHKCRALHHSNTFREKEKEFENAEILEKEIKRILRMR